MHGVSNAGGDASRPRTILLVEDDGLLRRVLIRMLSELGCVVLSAGSCGEARLLAEAYEHDIDILFTDVMLPDGVGPQLAGPLSSTRPALKIIYMSAHSRTYLDQANIPIDGVFLQKPFSMGQLDACLRGLCAPTDDFDPPAA